MLPVSFACDEPDTVAQQRVEQTMPVAAILDEVRRQQAAGLEPEAVEIARRAAYGETVSGLDEASTCAETLLSDWVDGIEPLSRLEALASLTVEELNDQLRRRLPTEQSTLSVIRPEPAP